MTVPANYGTEYSEAENAYSSGTPGSAFLTMRITV